jgi:hypothetical protein
VKLQIEPDILPSSLEIMVKEVQMTHDKRVANESQDSPSLQNSKEKRPSQDDLESYGI